MLNIYCILFAYLIILLKFSRKSITPSNFLADQPARVNS